MTTMEPPVSKPEPRKPATPAAAPPMETPEVPEAIRRHVTEDQICVLTFDRPGSQANLFDRTTLQQLNQHLNYVCANVQLKGLILFSAKPSIFVAGADIRALAEGAKREDVRQMIELGQTIFNRLATLSIPTVAAIHGACLGGGFEVCLACDYRIASQDKATKIGLPETQLGILPGWGGATRLPRLIGVPAALDMILTGKTVPAKVALKRGMVDEVVPKESLLTVARARIVKKGKALGSRAVPLKRRLLNSRLAGMFIARKVSKDLHKKTRGHYPALPKALEVVTRGVNQSIRNALLLEREAVADLSQTTVCHNLIRIFFLQERAKKLGRKGSSPHVKPIQRLAVIGAGVMGAGIAQWASARQLPVVLRDVNAEQVAKGMATVSSLYREGIKRHAFTAVEGRAGMDRVSPAPMEVPLNHVDLVIEAAVEKMDLKKQIFARLDTVAGKETILATNTSALSISEIASATSHPERVVGIHFFNPVHRMQLVEVVLGVQTSAEVAQKAVDFVLALGKLPVVVRDHPGFLVNRILMPYLVEAGRLFEGGASVQAIDKSMLDFGMPMGPLRLIDEVGVDVAQHVSHTLAARFPDRIQPPDVLAKMIDAGQLGRKSGGGFYLHKQKDKATANTAVDALRRDHRYAHLNLDQLRTRMVLLMINEAALCLEEGVVQAPEDVDFGMVMGTGFAPFLGGPLRLADSMGIDAVIEELRRLAGQGEAHFEPCERLKTMAAQQTTFYPKNGETPT